jgi:DNA-binding transcriptional ArsR family regulator
MVEYNTRLDLLFGALSDQTRRSILERASKAEMTISQIAENYKLTFAAISKHIKVLEKASLITKKRRGKELIVIVVPGSMEVAKKHVERYAKISARRFDRLEELFKEGN